MSSTEPTRAPRLGGVIAAMLTPMRDRGTQVDLDATTRLAGWLVERGVHGLYIAGTTGEGLYLSPEEHREPGPGGGEGGRSVPVAATWGRLRPPRPWFGSPGGSGRGDRGGGDPAPLLQPEPGGAAHLFHRDCPGRSTAAAVSL